jgi:TetR/AcrR family acrAB operon transcriptional repressor
MVRKTKREALETRASILDAAETLFQRRGVSRTSLQDIAQHAQVTRGAIYWHFKDKAELFNAMMERATMPLEQSMAVVASARPDAPLEQMRWGLLNAFHSTMHNERTRRVFEIAMHRVEYVDELLAVRDRHLAVRNHSVDQLDQGLRQAVALSQLPATVNTRVAGLALLAIVDGLIQNWILDPGAFDLLDVGRETVEAFLNSLQATSRPVLPPLSAAALACLGSMPVCSLAAPPQGGADLAPGTADEANEADDLPRP